MIEYVTSRAAAWDCPISLVGNLDQLEAHPRTPDNLEVIKRWEDVRARGWLTDRQKAALQNQDQEHMLLINENGVLELAPYSQIKNVAGQDGPARAFVFPRREKLYVVFWHMSGEGSMEIPLEARAARLLAELGKPRPLPKSPRGLRVPLAGRLYLECEGVSRDTIVRAFQNARILR